MSSDESPVSGSTARRRRLNDGSGLSIQESDMTDLDEEVERMSSVSRSPGGTSQRLFGDNERPYEIDSPLAFDARGPAPPPDISLPEADDRLANLELQLDGTPGRRYRGAPKAGQLALFTDGIRSGRTSQVLRHRTPLKCSRMGQKTRQDFSWGICKCCRT